MPSAPIFHSVFGVLLQMVSQSREKFVRLMEARTRKALKTIRLIGNLSNRTNYTFTTNDIDMVFQTLNKELKAARMKFEHEANQKSDIEFKLE